MKFDLELDEELYADLRCISGMDAEAELRKLLHDELDQQYDKFVEDFYEKRRKALEPK